MPKEQKCRAPLLRPFTDMETLVVALMIRGDTYKQIWTKLHISRSSVMSHLKHAAGKIPGDLRPVMRIHFWGRGATVDQLTGKGWMPGPPDQDGL